MPDPAGDAEQNRPVGVAELIFGVGHFSRVPGQHDLSPHQLEPVSRLRPDVFERAPCPVPGYLGRGHPSAHRLLGELCGVLTLVAGIAVTESQRLVGAQGGLVVPDVEIRTELRRRQMKLTADDLVACGHRQQDDCQPGQQEAGEGQPLAGQVTLAPDQPDEDRRHENHGVLAGQRQEPERHADP